MIDVHGAVVGSVNASGIQGRVLYAEDSVKFTLLHASEVTCSRIDGVGGGCVAYADAIVMGYNSSAVLQGIESAGRGAALFARTTIEVKSSKEAPSSVQCAQTSSRQRGGCVASGDAFATSSYARIECANTSATGDGGCVYSRDAFTAGHGAVVHCSTTRASAGGCVYSVGAFTISLTTRVLCTRTNATERGGCAFAVDSVTIGPNATFDCSLTSATSDGGCVATDGDFKAAGGNQDPDPSISYSGARITCTHSWTNSADCESPSMSNGGCVASKSLSVGTGAEIVAHETTACNGGAFHVDGTLHVLPNARLSCSRTSAGANGGCVAAIDVVTDDGAIMDISQVRPTALSNYRTGNS